MSLSEYQDFPILEVADACGIDIDNNTRSRTEAQARCPFCNDRKRRLYLNTATNQFMCQHCGKSGNSLTLYAMMHGIDNKTAYKALANGVGSILNVQQKKAVETKPQHDIKPLNNRHDVYYDLLQMLELSSVHRNNLFERGLESGVIEQNMYRSMQTGNYRRYMDIAKKLSKTHDLAGIPGFYRENGEWRFVFRKGILIPVCDYRGYIQGLQVRLDDAEKGKYCWFSSNHYNEGTRALTYIHATNLAQDTTVYLTEGALKADVASYLMNDAGFIAVPGVNAISGLTTLLKQLGIKEVVEMFDSDKLTNPNVANALASLQRTLMRAGIAYIPTSWNSTYKGIDDYMLALRRISAA